MPWQSSCRCLRPPLFQQHPKHSGRMWNSRWRRLWWEILGLSGVEPEEHLGHDIPEWDLPRWWRDLPRRWYPLCRRCRRHQQRLLAHVGMYPFQTPTKGYWKLGPAINSAELSQPVVYPVTYGRPSWSTAAPKSAAHSNPLIAFKNPRPWLVCCSRWLGKRNLRPSEGRVDKDECQDQAQVPIVTNGLAYSLLRCTYAKSAHWRCWSIWTSRKNSLGWHLCPRQKGMISRSCRSMGKGVGSRAET